MDRIERLTRNYLPQLFADYTGRAITLEEPPPGIPIDFVVRTAAGPFAVEATSSGRVAQIVRAAYRAREGAQVLGGLPLVVAPYIGQAGARAARAQDVHFFDLSGNASIRTDQLVIHVEGRQNRFPERGRPTSAFAPRSSRIARALLIDPVRWWRQAELAKTTELPSGTVSKIVSRLDQDDLLEVNGKRAIRPRDPSLLLDAWSDEYDFSRHDVVSAHVPRSEGTWLAETLAKSLESRGVPYAFTGLAAAWSYDQFASYRLVTVYLRDNVDDVLELAGARVGSRGANLQLVIPNDEGVFFGTQRLGRMICAAPVQTYLDLLHLPERSRDAADQLRAKRLDWRR